MRQFYPEGNIEPAGISKFNASGESTPLGDFKSVEVMTGDFENKNLFFTNEEDGLKIDWESWVGWSEMPWKEFRSSKPESSKVFRVTLSAVEYYNFDFLDEAKWQSYQLTSPDQEHSIYGYVERGSLMEKRFRLPPDVKSIPFMLKLKFHKDTRTNDQVEIEEVVNEGWIEEDAK